MQQLTERQKRQIAGAVAEVDPAQIEIIRRLTPAQRAQQALSMIRTAERSAAYRLRARQPDLNEGESLWYVRRREYNKEKAAFVDPNLEFNNFILSVVDALEEVGLTYLAGGSVAAWGWGEARTTLDFDVVVDLPFDQMVALSQALLQRNMNVPVENMIDIVLSPADLAINAIHGQTGFKAELFPLREGDKLRESALNRRLIVDLGPSIGELYVHSPEDLIIYKVLYYGLSQQSKHVRDIAGIFRVMGNELEMDYIQHWIETLDLVAVWQEIQHEIHSEG